MVLVAPCPEILRAPRLDEYFVQWDRGRNTRCTIALCIATSMSVCLSATPNFVHVDWRRTVRTSGFVDDVMFHIMGSMARVMSVCL